MTNEVKKLSDEAAKELAQAYSEYKTAEAKFKLLKDTLTKDLNEGKHITKYAIVNKVSSIRTTVDYKSACEDNDIDVSNYTTDKEVVTVTIQPLSVKTTSKKSLLKLF